MIESEPSRNRNVLVGLFEEDGIRICRSELFDSEPEPIQDLNFEAVVRAVNDTYDNDTIGAIVGAAAGALHGRKAIPDRWITDLPGRTSFDDDGKIYGLLDRTKALCGAEADGRR